jgi:hypothetical protein
MTYILLCLGQSQFVPIVSAELFPVLSFSDMLFWAVNHTATLLTSQHAVPGQKLWPLITCLWTRQAWTSMNSENKVWSLHSSTCWVQSRKRSCF